MTVAGNRLLVGGPGEGGSTGNENTGRAYLYDVSSGIEQELVLKPFRMGTNVMEDDPTGDRRFGVGSSIISEGHYVIGSDPTTSSLPQTLYNFRHRGPSFAAVQIDVNPVRLETAKVGTSIAIDGNTAVVGARDFDNRGAAFVYVQDEETGAWSLQATLQSEETELDDQFGIDVAISGDTIVVGTGNGGSAYVFQRLGNAWSEPTEISQNVDGFGSAVDIDIDTLVIGAGASNAGYIYELQGTAWMEQESVNDSGVSLGSAVAVDGDTVVFGAPDDGSGGSAYVYVDSPTGWMLQQTLTADDGVTGDAFGTSVDISGERIIIGAPEANDSVGAAYTFARDETSWTQTQPKLELASGVANDKFGYDVAIDGKRAIVGASGRDRLTLEDVGEAFAFGFKNGTWRLETAVDPLEGADTAPGDQLGYAVAISGNVAMLGAPQLDGRPGLLIDTDGAGYVYLREVSAPTSVTAAVRQEVLLAGAQANAVSGFVGGKETSEFVFFDIADVTITTGAADDLIEVAKEGLTALGLQNFVVETGAGADTLTLRTTQLTPPAVGSFVPFGDFSNANLGDDIPQNAGYDIIAGAFTFDGGDDDDHLVVSAGDADWQLNGDVLIANNLDELQVSNVEDASINGGKTANVIRINAWAGTVSVDGAGGADQIILQLGEVVSATVDDTGAGNSDSLRVLGTELEDQLFVTDGAVTLGSNVVNYAGIEVLSVTGRGGDDELNVLDSSANVVNLDGAEGSDDYQLSQGTSDTIVDMSDTGSPPTGIDNGEYQGEVDTLFLPPNTAFPAVDQTISVDGNKSARRDETIEHLDVGCQGPIRFIQGSEDADEIVLDGQILTITVNGVSVNHDISCVTELTVDALGGNDTFILIDRPDTLTLLDFIGGGGSDTLQGSNNASTWTVTGNGQGNISGAEAAVFSQMENLVGDTAADRFVFQGSASILGDLTDFGDAVLDYSGFASPVIVNLSAGTASAIGGSLSSSIDQFIGTTALGDSIVGPSGDNLTVWNVTAPDAGTIAGTIIFEDFENLTGGTGDDSFLVTAGLAVAGLVDGGGGENDLSLGGTESGEGVSIQTGRVTIGSGQTDYANIDDLTVQTFGGIDDVHVDLAGDFPATLRLDSGSDGDEIDIDVAPAASTRVVLNGVAGATDKLTVNGTSSRDRIDINDLRIEIDNVDIEHSGVEDLIVAAAAGDDDITFTGAGFSGSVQLRGDENDDQIGLVFPIVTTSLSVDGGSGDADELDVQTLDAPEVITLDASLIEVSGQPNTSYGGFEILDIATRGGGDLVTIEQTITGTTSIDTGSEGDEVTIEATSGTLNLDTGIGEDVVQVQSIGGNTEIRLGEDDDIVNVSSDAPDNTGTLDGISSQLRIFAGENINDNDQLNVSDAGNTTGRAGDDGGSLSSSNITGLGMASGIFYLSFEDLNLVLGSGNDEFTIGNTHEGTTSLLTHAGDDVINVQGTAGPTTIDAGTGRRRRRD